jgi:hypothetical protein
VARLPDQRQDGQVRRISLVVFAVALAVVVAGAVIVNLPGPSGPQAPLPPSSASARTVAVAFLDAAVRRDCRDMRALSAPHDTSWCPASLWDQWHGEGDPTMSSWTTVRSTSGRSDPEQCFDFGMRESGLVGMEPGPNVWGLCLRHHAEGWRVSSEGVG